MNKELYTDSLKFQNKGIFWNLSEFRTNVKKKKKKSTSIHRVELVISKRFWQFRSIKRCEKHIARPIIN